MTTVTTHLKPGDEVGIMFGSLVNRMHEVATVKHVTPTGVVVLTDGRRFTARGYQYGHADRRYGAAPRLVPADAGFRANAARPAATTELRGLLRGWEQWPTDNMEAIARSIEAVAEASEKDRDTKEARRAGPE